LLGRKKKRAGWKGETPSFRQKKEHLLPGKESFAGKKSNHHNGRSIGERIKFRKKKGRLLKGEGEEQHRLHFTKENLKTDMGKGGPYRCVKKTSRR